MKKSTWTKWILIRYDGSAYLIYAVRLWMIKIHKMESSNGWEKKISGKEQDLRNSGKYRKVNNQKLRTKIHLKYGKLIWNILFVDKYEKQ